MSLFLNNTKLQAAKCESFLCTFLQQQFETFKIAKLKVVLKATKIITKLAIFSTAPMNN